MKISKLKKVHAFELKQQFKQKHGVDIMDYKFSQFIDDLCDDGIYEYDYSETKSKLRITFILFCICCILLFIFSSIKWLFTGSFYYSTDQWVIKKMIAWDKYCRFKILS